MIKLNIKPSLAISAVSLIFSGVSLFLNHRSKKRLTSAVRKLDSSVDTLIDGGLESVHIAQSVVDDAVKEFCKREVSRMIPEAVEAGRKEAVRKFEQDVRAEVNAQYVNVRKSVEDKTMEYVKKLDMDKMAESIVEYASNKVKTELYSSVKVIEMDFKDNLNDILDELKDEAKEDFDDKIEELIDDFKDRMDDMVKIYSAVAGRMS